MAGYVGNVPVPQSVREDQSFTATAGQTTFNTLGYTDGNRIKVTLNGVLLEGGGVDYTATNGSDVVLTVAAAADDIIRFETFNEFTLVNSTMTTPTLTGSTLKSNVTLKNDTEQDTDGGRASKIIYQGEQSGGEISTLAEIQASHDGTADDEKGDLIFRTNDGSDGSSPTEAMRIDSGGHVGINKTNPDTPLDVVAATGEQVVGRFAASNNSSSVNNGGAILKLQNTNNTNGNQSTLVFADSTDSSIGGIFGYNTNHSNASGYITVGTRDSGTFAERIRVDHDGLKFNGDTAAANALDDYEEGTWNPGVNYGTLSHSGAVYTKVGNLVTVTANVYNFSDRSSSNTVGINSLPFTSASSGSYVGSIIGRYISHSGVGYSAYIGSSSGSVYFYEAPQTGDYHTMKHSDFAASSGADFHFTVTYRT